MGAGGVIFDIVKYIKNQYTEDKFYGFLLILTVFVFVLALCVLFIKPIVICFLIYKMHKGELGDNKNNVKYIKGQLGKVIDYQISSNLNRKNIDSEEIKKIIKELSNIKED